MHTNFFAQRRNLWWYWAVDIQVIIHYYHNFPSLCNAPNIRTLFAWDFIISTVLSSPGLSQRDAFSQIWNSMHHNSDCICYYYPTRNHIRQFDFTAFAADDSRFTSSMMVQALKLGSSQTESDTPARPVETSYRYYQETLIKALILLKERGLCLSLNAVFKQETAKSSSADQWSFPRAVCNYDESSSLPGSVDGNAVRLHTAYWLVWMIAGQLYLKDQEMSCALPSILKWQLVAGLKRNAQIESSNVNS